MRVADYIFKTLADRGADTVFLVTGGGAMHLNDALGREKRLHYVCCLHEQACAMAAEGYARIRNRPGIVSVTTGPGGTNALTGVAGAWLDSIPMLVISGQVKTETMCSNWPHLQVRQIGDQELNIIDLVRPITKYAVCVRDPQEIRYELEKALVLCSSGRPGPVWLDIPLDVQAAEMKDSFRKPVFLREPLPEPSGEDVAYVLEKLRTAKRPALIAGNGIRLAGGVKAFRQLTERLGIPVLTAISGIDLIASDSPLFFGRPGILGERPANFIVQNADLLLILGTRMGIRMTGYSFDTFAPRAFKIMVDVDPGELKRPLFPVSYPIHADAGRMIQALLEAQPTPLPGAEEEWLTYCREKRKQYPVVTATHRERTDYVSTYYFADLLSDALADNAVVVTGNGTAYTSTYQAIRIKPGMRVFANQGCASMGYDLPAAIGAALADRKRPVVCITGDGSIQMNLQELQTIVNHRLAIKIFVFSNQGYLSIKLTQNSFFHGFRVGSDPGSGVCLPEIRRIAEAYGIRTYLLSSNRQAEEQISQILAEEGPVLCEVRTDPLEELGPKVSSSRLPDGRLVSRPLEDLAPFLPREELERNMAISRNKEQES